MLKKIMEMIQSTSGVVLVVLSHRVADKVRREADAMMMQPEMRNEGPIYSWHISGIPVAATNTMHSYLLAEDYQHQPIIVMLDY